MNRKAKFDFYRSIEPRSIADEKAFWKAVKPTHVFKWKSNGRKIVLIEDEVIISDDAMIDECFNSHFVNITLGCLIQGGTLINFQRLYPPPGPY